MRWSIGSRAKLSLRLLSGRSRSFRNSQRGPPCGTIRQGAEGDDYRKWPCICRNYRNNGNKTKALTQHSDRCRQDHLLDNSPFLPNDSLWADEWEKKKNVLFHSERRIVFLSFSASSSLPFLLNNALRWPYALGFLRTIPNCHSN